MNPGEIHPYLSADRPIQTSKEDLFGRKRFAQAIAKVIRGWTNQHSLVMALYGSWGVGKTSTKNLILESLTPDLKSRVLEFNPWEWSGRDQIQKAFFAELSNKLKKADPSVAGQKRVEQLEQYAALLEGVSINDGFTRVGELTAIFAGFITLKTVLETFAKLPEWLKSLLTICVAVLGILVFTATFFRWAFKSAAGFLNGIAPRKDQSLTLQRNELISSLRKLGAPLLIVIDDIDRLTSIEIAQVFQLVKANADFPNLVFLVLFDRAVVEKNLEEITKGNPAEYLEKIVQTGFTIPPATRTEIDEYVFENIKTIFTHGFAGQRFDEGELINAYLGTMREYIRDLRDAKRFLGSLAVHAAIFQGDNTFEVNPRDLVLLETLRVFESDLYDEIARSKEWFVPRHQSMQGQQQEITVKSVMTAAKSNPSKAQEIVVALFPNLGSIFGKSSYGSDFRPTWFRESRVCHPDVFDRYFQLGIPRGDVSQSEIENVLALIGDTKRLVREFESFKQRNLIAPLLDRLDNYKTNIDPNKAATFLAALFEIGDDFDDGLNWGGPQRQLFRLAYFCFRECVPSDSRFSVFQQALVGSQKLYLPMNLLVSCQENSQDERPVLLQETEFNMIQVQLKDRIEDAARSGLLLEQLHRQWIFYRWAEWTSNDYVKTWMKIQLKDRPKFSKLLTGFYSQSSSSAVDSYVSHITTYISLEGLTTFLTQEEVFEAWKQLGVTQPTQEESALLEAIRNARSRGQFLRGN